jgi:hypothetical protein
VIFVLALRFLEHASRKAAQQLRPPGTSAEGLLAFALFDCRTTKGKHGHHRSSAAVVGGNSKNPELIVSLSADDRPPSTDHARDQSIDRSELIQS